MLVPEQTVVHRPWLPADCCPCSRFRLTLISHAAHSLFRQLTLLGGGTQLVMLGNVVAFPLSAFALAKCWMQTPSLLWPVTCPP